MCACVWGACVSMCLRVGCVRERVCMRVCLRVGCVRERVRVCMRVHDGVHVHKCVRACVHVCLCSSLSSFDHWLGSQR